MPDVFSLPIFFVVFRETLEAAIIISVLLSLVEGLVQAKSSTVTTDQTAVGGTSSNGTAVAYETDNEDDDETHKKSFMRPFGARKRRNSARPLMYSDDERKLLRKLRIQIFAGAGTGLLIAFIIGAAFLAVYYTKLTDLYGGAEDLWEGVFCLVASLMIWVMGITMLRMDRAKIKWKIKLHKAFLKNDDIQNVTNPEQNAKRARSSKWALFLLPAITVLREGLEAVVFVGGVSLGQAATSIPLAAIVGLICGLIVGFLLYKSSSRINTSIVLVAMTALLLLIGAGLFSRSVGNFETYKFVQLVGADVAETGNGPGSYSVHGNVWHLDCCNPENKTSGYGWGIFNALLGWNNNASIGTILSYVFYWLSAIGALVYMKWKEGRVQLFGLKSAAWQRRRAYRSAPAVPGGASGSKTRRDNMDTDAEDDDANEPHHKIGNLDNDDDLKDGGAAAQRSGGHSTRTGGSSPQGTIDDKKAAMAANGNGDGISVRDVRQVR